MADHFIHELSQTIRHSPMRAALAAVVLITTTIYVCAGHEEYRVAEMGDDSASDQVDSTGEVIELTAHSAWVGEIEPMEADEEDAPATTTRVAGRERYIDAHLTHAVAVEVDSDAGNLRRVEHVSGEPERRPSGNAPVWLLGVLEGD